MTKILSLLFLLLLLGLGSAHAATEYFSESLSSTPLQVKASSARLLGYKLTNTNGVPIYVHFYDALSANVTVGTTLQAEMIPVPATGAVLIPINGVAQKLFSTALTIAATTLPLFSGTTAPTTALVVTISYE
jgi:hypothetical protein